MLATMLSANPSNAADQTYDLYYVTNSGQLEQLIGTQFRRVGNISSTTNSYLYPCAVDLDNNVWVSFAMNSDPKPGISTKTEASECVPENKSSEIINFHSDLWSGYVAYQNESTIAYLGIDADGYLWEQHGEKNTSSVFISDPTALTMVRPGVKFHVGAAPSSTSAGGTAFLLGTSRASQSTSIVQMPTTGAPTGLSTFGVIAVGLILMGLALKLKERLI